MEFCFTYLSTDEHFCFFYLLIIVTSAAMNAFAQIFLSVSVCNSLGYIPKSGVFWSYGNSVTFGETPKLFSKVGIPFYIPTNNVLHVFSNTYYFLVCLFFIVVILMCAK